MSVKVFIEVATNAIVKTEPVKYKEVIFENATVEDTIVICEKTGNICRLQDSEQGKARLKKLLDKKEPTEFEKQEIKFLSSETQSEKETDKKEAQEILLSGQYIVNITNKGKKKIATIHDAQTASADGIEFDTERGDKFFDTIEKAEEYVASKQFI